MGLRLRVVCFGGTGHVSLSSASTQCFWVARMNDFMQLIQTVSFRHITGETPEKLSRCIPVEIASKAPLHIFTQ